VDLAEISIVQHPSVPAEDVWIIREKESPQEPSDLRDDLTVPFILTGDAEGARNLLSLVRAIGR
jgi:hypothetical protein